MRCRDVLSLLLVGLVVQVVSGCKEPEYRNTAGLVTQVYHARNGQQFIRLARMDFSFSANDLVWHIDNAMYSGNAELSHAVIGDTILVYYNVADPEDCSAVRVLRKGTYRHFTSGQRHRADTLFRDLMPQVPYINLDSLHSIQERAYQPAVDKIHSVTQRSSNGHKPEGVDLNTQQAPNTK